MAEIKLVKKYPNIRDEDVIEIFQEGYLKGFENGRKNAIPVEWIEKFMNRFRLGMVTSDEYALLHFMLTEWEVENEKSGISD